MRKKKSGVITLKSFSSVVLTAKPRFRGEGGGVGGAGSYYVSGVDSDVSDSCNQIGKVRCDLMVSMCK